VARPAFDPPGAWPRREEDFLGGPVRGMGSCEDETADFFCTEALYRKFNELKSCRPLPGIDYLVLPFDSND
jgi:hypothetical protein